MAATWTLKDLTELDLRIQRNLSVDDQAQEENVPKEGGKSEVLQTWLREKRRSDPEAERLAGLAIRSVSWLGLSLRILSFLAGLSAAAALLRYHGRTLMNVSHYLGVLVGLQLLFLVLTLAGSLIFRKQLSGLQQWLLPQQIKQLDAPLSLKAWAWHSFLILQTSGIAFNAGVLLATLGKGITHDLAFGWATTLETSGESIARLVETLARPWGGGYAPTLEQINLSRISSLNPVNLTDPSATAAWWPFIMACVLFYGLLPRIILSLWGFFQVHRQLRNPEWTSSESERLYLQLTRKPFTFSGEASAAELTEKPATFPSAFQPEQPLKLLVEEQILPADKLADFSKALQEGFGIDLDTEAQGRLKLIELWQPPLEESLRELRTLRTEIPMDADILILGVGLPAPDKAIPFLPPEEADLEIWKKRLSELKDPRLGILPWREN